MGQKTKICFLVIVLFIGIFALLNFWNNVFADTKEIKVLNIGDDLKWSPDGKKISFGAAIEKKVIEKKPNRESVETKILTFNILTIDLNGSNLKTILPLELYSSYRKSQEPEKEPEKKNYYPGGYKPPTPESKPKPILPVLTYDIKHDWSPDGAKIVFADSVNRFSDNDEIYIWTINNDGTNLNQILKTRAEHLILYLQWLKNEKIIYNTRTKSNLFYLINPNGTSAGQIALRENNCIQNPHFSNDGKRIVYNKGRNIWIYGISAMNGINLTKMEYDSSQMTNNSCSKPSLSPDGKRIVFTFDDQDDKRIWTINADGNNSHPLTKAQPVKTTDSYYEEYSPRWSPDGKMITYLKYYKESGRKEIWVMDSDGTKHICLMKCQSN